MPRCLSCLLNAAFHPGANPQLQNRICPLIFFFFPFFFMIILTRIHKEKGKKKSADGFADEQSSPRPRLSVPAPGSREKSGAATKRCSVSPLRFSASCFRSIIARPENTFCRQLPGATVGGATSFLSFVFCLLFFYPPRRHQWNNSRFYISVTLLGVTFNLLH